MRTPPPDLTEDQLLSVLSEHWQLAVTSIDYAPVGFGSHHWQATTAAGERWFVTADAVPDRAALESLQAALSTAELLRRDAGLSFVLAPIHTSDGNVLAQCAGYAVTAFPFLDELPATDHPASETARLLATLHSATATVRAVAPPDDLDVDDRQHIETVLDDGNAPPAPGPYGTAFVALIREHHDQLRVALARHDAFAATLGGDRMDWVITHGEPKPDNIMITDRGPMLIDWDTARLAPAARDLWMAGSLEEYQQLTDRPVPEDQLDFYRRRWDLADLAAFAGWFVRPHAATPDTEIGWRACVDICDRLDR